MSKLKVKSEKLEVTRGPARISFSKKNLGGFTLIEIIVALGIFITAVSISIGALVGLYDANSKSQSLSSVISNLNYSVENMVRTIRFAESYHCGSGNLPLTTPRPCYDGDLDPGSNPNDVFLAVTEAGLTTIFKYNNVSKKIETSIDGGSTYTPVTSSEVTITYAKFYTFFTEPLPDDQQPQVVLVIRGFAGKKPSSQSSFDIQTVVSQRKLDL